MKDAPKGRCRAAAPQTPQNGNAKTPDFVDTMVWKVLSDLPFSRNQLKLVDDYYIRLLKNK